MREGHDRQVVLIEVEKHGAVVLAERSIGNPFIAEMSRRWHVGRNDRSIFGNRPRTEKVLFAAKIFLSGEQEKTKVDSKKATLRHKSYRLSTCAFKTTAGNGLQPGGPPGSPWIALTAKSSHLPNSNLVACLHPASFFP